MDKISWVLDYHKNLQKLDGILYFDKRMQYKIYPCAKSISLENYCEDVELRERKFIETLLLIKGIRT